MKTLANKVVVITGAGSGIGRALALSAKERGATIALCDWNGDAVAETLRMTGGRGIATRVDVRSEDEVASFAAQVEKELGPAHVVVNNAGVSLSDTVGSMTRTDFEWLFDINFWGVVRGTELFLPQLSRQDDAHIVNISSVFGLIAVPSQSAYNASKFAVRGYTEALRQELEGTHVHVTCVHPGGVRTNIVRHGRHNVSSRGDKVTTETVSAEFDKVVRTTPEAAAGIIWRGVLANDPRVLVGADARLMDLTQRLFPKRYPQIFNALRSVFERATGARM